MAIYIPPEPIEVEEKHGQVMAATEQATNTKTYTEAEVIAMLSQLQKGNE